MFIRWSCSYVALYSITKERRKEGKSEGRKEGKSEGRKERRKESAKEGKDEGRKERTTEGRKEQRKEGSKGRRKELRKEGKNEGRKERTKKGRQEGSCRILICSGFFHPFSSSTALTQYNIFQLHRFIHVKPFATEATLHGRHKIIRNSGSHNQTLALEISDTWPTSETGPASTLKDHQNSL